MALESDGTIIDPGGSLITCQGEVMSWVVPPQTVSLAKPNPFVTGVVHSRSLLVHLFIHYFRK